MLLSALSQQSRNEHLPGDSGRTECDSHLLAQLHTRIERRGSQRDIGLLYDPSRALERDICNRLRASFRANSPALLVRRNYPYFGKANGFPAYLRRRFPVDAYVAIELEINQKHVLKGGRQWRLLRSAILKSLAEAVVPNISGLPDGVLQGATPSNNSAS